VERDESDAAGAERLRSHSWLFYRNGNRCRCRMAMFGPRVLTKAQDFPVFLKFIFVSAEISAWISFADQRADCPSCTEHETLTSEFAFTLQQQTRHRRGFWLEHCPQMNRSLVNCFPECAAEKRTHGQWPLVGMHQAVKKRTSLLVCLQRCSGYLIRAGCGLCYQRASVENFLA
jgi:hypothetical protein